VDRAAERATHRLPAESPIAVFGGQIAVGRGFEQILAAARHALEEGSSLRFLLIGDGPLAAMIAARAAALPNVELRLPIAREDYLRLIAACDVGLAATVAGVTSFSFPSKILDYLAAGLPVVAALEPGNEACAILESFEVGVSVPLGEPRSLFLSAERLAADPLARARARHGGRRCLEDIFDVRHTVSALLRASA
jgi:glycosyltransferase involved in cell wall biosynthesis